MSLVIRNAWGKIELFLGLKDDKLILQCN